MFDQFNYSPFIDHLWEDEQTEKRVIYPLRVAVDFVSIPKIDLGAITWSDIDRLESGGRKVN